MSRALSLVLAITLVCSSSAYGDWAYNPTTQHYYRATCSHETWAQANAEAQAAGGYLTTINDDSENAWLTQFAVNLYRRNGAIPNQGNLAWIGYRDAGSGFGWENGEPVSYTNLAAGCTEWSSYAGSHAYIHGANHQCPGVWNHNPIHGTDFGENIYGIIERDGSPGPDCSGCESNSCGDGNCRCGEGCTSCPEDCGSCPPNPCDANFCGDGVCRCGEDTCDCPTDCGMNYCGDGACRCSETCCNCSQDCQGVCSDGICIPTVSQWGLVILGLLTLTAGTLVVRQRMSAS